MAKQKIVIQVQMKCDKCRSKAMSLVAATGGVESVALAGDAKDQVVVVGDGVDCVKLTSALRKKVGLARLVQVADAAKKKEEEKKPAAPPAAPGYQLYYHCPAPPQPATVVYEYPAAGYGYGYGTSRVGISTGATPSTKKSSTMKQRIVIRVEMTCDKCRSKAMALVAATGGVDSVALAGDAKDQVVVVDDNVDSIKLTSALRKKVGPAQLVHVADAAKKKEEEKKPTIVAAPEYQWCYPQPANVVYEYGHYCSSRPDNTCSIM
ncbi:hypothetical protein QOZ80_2BG0191070 [Eleusine coracana subsp. coracana]|nr:hypothetical protein QOZ80_2BG0191070 [Eleusine coracana subsp. coracana]